MSGVVDVVFWIFAALAIASAVVVVTITDVFRAAMALAGSLLAVAVIFFLLQAPFLGVVQILVYVGAISVVIAFAILMTRNVSQGSLPQPNRVIVTGAGLFAGLFIILAGVIAYETNWTHINEVRNPDAQAALTGKYEEGGAIIGGDEQTALVEASPGNDRPDRDGVFTDSTGWLGRALIQEHVLAFEVLGALLLAGLIGAIALVREEASSE
ncbi:MAG: NADH-quinone oxidoreductase subunit J [Chloroflexota bacterium]